MEEVVVEALQVAMKLVMYTEPTREAFCDLPGKVQEVAPLCFQYLQPVGSHIKENFQSTFNWQHCNKLSSASFVCLVLNINIVPTSSSINS
jgi:hypothetical protein